jgi:hypothetical protein
MAAPASVRLGLLDDQCFLEALARVKASNFKWKTKTFYPELLDGFGGLLRGGLAIVHLQFRYIGEIRTPLPKAEADFVFEKSLLLILKEWQSFWAKASGTRTITS